MFKTTIGYFDSAPRDVPYLGYPDANDLSGTSGFFRQQDHPATVAAINKTIAGAKAAGIPVCLGVNSRPAEQRDLIARGVRVLLATSDVVLLAGGALRVLAANREAIGH